MVEYKFYYGDARGLGEYIRLIFAASGQKFEDVRIPMDKWPEWKPKAPFGQVPYLEVIDGSDKLTLSQSKAIARYLSRKYGLAGKTEQESALIDMYGDQLADLLVDIGKSRYEKDEEKKKELVEKLEKEILPVQLKHFEERLAKSGSGFIASSGLSWVDLLLYVISDFFPNKNQVLQPFKLIRENREKIEANSGISKWLKTRPVTEF